MKRLFEVAAEVDAAGKAPPFYAKATVFALVGADTEEAAAMALRLDLETSGYVLLDARIRVEELRGDAWAEHVARRLAEIAGELDAEVTFPFVSREGSVTGCGNAYGWARSGAEASCFSGGRVTMRHDTCTCSATAGSS